MVYLSRGFFVFEIRELITYNIITEWIHTSVQFGFLFDQIFRGTRIRFSVFHQLLLFSIVEDAVDRGAVVVIWDLKGLRNIFFV